MNDQLTGATGKLGIFGRTLSQINNDLSQGKFASLFHLVPKSEITALQSYGQALLSNSNKIKNWDKALAKGKINQQTYNQTIENTVGSLKGLSTTSQLLGIKIKQLHSDFLADKMSASEFTMQVNTLIGVQKAATVATQVLGTALKTAFNIGIGIAISAIISWIQDLITENQRMAEISKQAADEIKDELNGLEDYSEKIISLRKELESTNTTTERAADVRQELYDIQKDLIENYGVEKDSIDLVTGSIKDQIEELKNLGKQKYDSQYYSNYQATQTTLGNLNNLDLVLDDRAWRDYANQMWQNSNASRFRDDVQDYMKSVLESAGFKYEGGFYKLDGNAFDVNDALVSVEKQVEQAINSLDINDYPNPAAYADAEKQLRHVLEYLSAVNKDVTSPLIEHEEELAQYIKYNEKYSEQYWKMFTARANYEAAQERGIQEEIIAARQAFIDTYNGLVIDDGDNAVSWWFEKEFGEVTNESEKAANTTVKNLNPIKDKLNELNSAVSEFKETIDTAFSSQSTLQSAFDKIQEGASLSADEVRKLVEICPELAVEFTKTVDGYTVSSDALIKANDNIIQSTKESVEAQIKGYQEVIDKYNEIKNAASMPESARQDRLKALGITEDDIKNAEQQINQYRLILGMLGITFEKTTEEISKYNQIIKDNSSKVSLIASATKEMTDEGHISASTYAELVEKGGNFTECLEVQNGKLVLNIDKLKELEKQEYLNMIAENNLAIKKLETTERTSSNAKAIWEEIQAYKTENALLQQMANEIDDAGVEEPPKDTSDPIKEAFEKDMKEIEHLHNMGLKSDKEYYDALETANEKHYKNSAEHESDYLSNVEKIYKARQELYADDADKQFDDLEDQYKKGIISAEQYAKAVYDLGQKLYGEDSLYGGTEFAKKKLEELDKTVKEVSDDIYKEFKEGLGADGDKTLFNILSDAEELWDKTNELFAGDLTTIKSNAKDIFGTVSSALEDALKKGIITVDGYESLLRSWANTLEMTEADITDALVDTYEYRADALQKANDGSLASERKYIADMKALNFSTYGDENSDFYDPNTYASNLRDITDHELDVLEEALKKGEISTREYAEAVAEILGDADVLGADYIAEKQEEIDKVRAEREKEYWEQQKELVEDYYDKQIEELEKIQDEQEKITKAEELRLNLIKARKTLEEAKNNRNQLVFHNGTFEYMADQDAVMSAEEEVAEAVKAIKENELQEQIDLLKSQKDEALSFYDDMISMIEAYINETVNISESDSETLKKIADSRYSKEWKDVRYGDKTANEVTEEQKKAVEKSEDKSDTKADSNDKVTVKADNVEVKTDTNSSTDIQSDNVPEPDDTAPADTVSSIATTIKEVGDSLLAFINSFGNGSAFENLVRALGGNPTAEGVQNFKDSYNATLVGKQITPSTVEGAVTNNNSTTNNATKVINVGGITVKLELTVQSLDDFVNNKIDTAMTKLGNAIEQEMPKILAKA